MKLSLCLIVKNEEKYLWRCLESLYKYVDEIIITDTGSTDSTLDIAKKYTDKIYHFEWCDDFSAARNYCQSHAVGDYILWMDADEWFLERDIKNFRRLLEVSTGFDFFSINIIHIQNQKSIRKEQKLKVFKNFKWYHWIWKIHEIIDTSKIEDTYGKGSYAHNINFYHTLKHKDKFWTDMSYFEKHFEREKENSTVVLILLKHYFKNQNREKLRYILKNTPYIHWRSKNLYVDFLLQLPQDEYAQEILLLRRILKKSILLEKHFHIWDRS